MLSVFITPCTNPTSIHCATSDAWAATTASNSARYGFSAVGGAGMVPGDRVVGEPPHQIDVAGGRGVLEAAHPQVAARHPREHGSRQQRLAVDRATRGHDGQRPGGGNAQRVHRLADDVFAQHRADRGQAVAAARERRGARTLEMEVAKPAVGVDDFAQQQRASVAQPRDVTRRTGARRRPAPPAWRRRGPRCRPGDRTPSGPRSQAASRPRSAANRSLSTSSRGSGGSSACQRTAISGSSRENRSSRTTAASDAMLTSPRLRMGNWRHT